MRAVWGVVTIMLGACGDDGGGASGGTDWPEPVACEDTSNDPFHCGACGHSCWGGQCVEGICQAVNGIFPGGSTPSVVVDDIALGGTGAEVLLTKLATYHQHQAVWVEMTDVVSSRAFAIDEGFAYWTAADGIYRCPVDGGCENHPEHIFTESPPALESSQLAYAYGFTVAGGNVFVVRGQALFGVDKMIEHCAVDSCTSLTTLYSDPTANYLNDLVSDGTYLAWFRDSSVWSCTVADCAATAHQVAATAVMPNPRQFPLALVDGTLAWADVQSPSFPYNTHVMACQLPACTPTDLYTEPESTYDLTIHGGRVYVNGQTGIVSVALTGGPPELIPITPDNSMIYASDAFFVLGNGKVAR